MPRTTPKPDQHKRRVLLLCTQPLLGEGLHVILGRLQDIELIGPLTLDEQIASSVPTHHPDVIVVADNGAESTNAAHLATHLLESFPDIPVIQVGLEQNLIRLFTSKTLPARSADLIETIRRLPAVVVQQPTSQAHPHGSLDPAATSSVGERI